MDPTQPQPTATPNWAQIDEEIHCPLCEYDLRMLSEPRCPECGYRFEWEELLDPARRRHPYIFEHHPEANLRSFRRTVLNGLRPRRFWASLHPAQPSSPRRLVLYWCVAAMVYAVPLAAEFTSEITALIRSVPAQRARMVAWYNAQAAAGVTRGEIAQFGSIPAWVDYHCPKVNSLTTLWHHLAGTYLPAAMIGYLLFPLLWPWVTFSSLLVFRISMRRARIRPTHVLRCTTYNADVMIWMGLFISGALVASLFQSASLAMPGPTHHACLGFCVPTALFGIYRLYVACRFYLRLDHPLAMVLASQVIVFLVGVNLVAPTWL